MLNVFFGTDTTKVRQEAFDFVDKINKEDCEVVKITPENYVSGTVLELAQSNALFDTKQIIVFDTPSEDKHVEEDILNNLATMQDSSNNFVLLEGPYDAARKKKVQKHAENFNEIKSEKKERLNVFGLTDALLRRDKKSIWLLFYNLHKEGVSNEEIIGILFWQIKILRLVSRTNSAEEAGQKPFVYQKAKRALSNFKEGEIDSLSRSLLSIYHDGHLGLVDLDLALEKWLLEV